MPANERQTTDNNSGVRHVSKYDDVTPNPVVGAINTIETYDGLSYDGFSYSNIDGGIGGLSTPFSAASTPNAAVTSFGNQLSGSPRIFAGSTLKNFDLVGMYIGCRAVALATGAVSLTAFCKVTFTGYGVDTQGKCVMTRQYSAGTATDKTEMQLVDFTGKDDKGRSGCFKGVSSVGFVVSEYQHVDHYDGFGY
ncbi:hypothetical protein LTS18_002647 [Coniosporium uncinatum]|uniref:Uncharacterized protein n=1 Tax=Coniosporium uncinatum TaxID=93489 RepID=A0ACC3DU18_9PEZI|nr:hypothetical protein LTS18_002647 [Coniosporium uncinatum]